MPSQKTAHIEFPPTSPLVVAPLAENLEVSATTKNWDVRAEFEDITRKTPRDAQAEQAFIASKLHIINTDPRLETAERESFANELLAGVEQRPTKDYAGPIPGGVGYGMFYNSPFKTDFVTATSIYCEIICPNPPGGNVNTFLYLTATNRSAKGVEAFISYNGQDSTFFKVFDWARNPSAPWQTNVPFASLANYLTTRTAHGGSYSVLQLFNQTDQAADNLWYNQVWLWNQVATRWDLIYQYGYSATLVDQKTGWVGSWGPIVETFQSPYKKTNTLGFLNTQLINRAANNVWGPWQWLNATNSFVRTDNNGFLSSFLDANFSWAVHS
jgi:hypothetical protein